MSENLELEKQNILGINLDNLAKLANVEVKLKAQLGKTRIPLKNTLELDSGSIVELDIKEDEPIDIYVDKVKVAKGQIVTIDNCYAVKITEIIHNM